MAKTKKKTKLEQLKAAALELQEVLGLVDPHSGEPVFSDESMEDTTVNGLAGKIREASELIDEDDELSAETAEIVADLTEDFEETEDEEVEPEDEDEEIEDAEVVEEELTLEDLRAEVEGAAKRKELRLLVEEIDFFEPLVERLPDLKSKSTLQGAILKFLDAEMGETEGIEVDEVEIEEPEVEEKAEAEEPKEEKPKPAKKEKAQAKKKKAKPKKQGASITRMDAVVQAINELCKKGATKKELMARSDEIYVQSGGASNPTATNVHRHMLHGLIEFSILEENDGVFILK